MSDIKIVTNNAPRPILYGYEIEPAELEKEFGIKTDELEEYETRHFVRYKGNLVAIDDFMTTRSGPFNHGLPEQFNQWDGYASDSFFSGLLVRYCEDNESVIIGRYLS